MSARSLVIGTAGHIDHGKSTLVQALTGIDPDRLKEEKARGITIDLGFAHAEIDGVQVAFVDVPGHERFVKNMLAGVGGIDAVLLVVAADESVMPQTREHFEICRLLGIPSGVIAITKSDLADRDAIDLTRLEVKDLVAQTILEDAPIIEVSARTGAGLGELRAALARLNARDRAHASGRSEADMEPPVRVPIDRVFSIRGFGTVVTGTLISGVLRENDELTVAPGVRRVKVRGLQMHGSPQAAVNAGHRVAVNVGGAEVAEIARGDTLITPGSFDAVRRTDAMIELLPGARPLRQGTRIRFHHGTSEILGRVSLAALREPQDAGAPVATSLTSELQPGREAYVRLRLESPAVLARGDRFILRAYSPPATIAGGEILDPQPPRAGVRTESGRRRFVEIDPTRAVVSVLRLWVEEGGAQGLVLRAVRTRLGCDAESARTWARELEAAGENALVGETLVSRRVLDELGRRTLAEVEAHHRANPLSDGLPREELRTRVFGHAADAVFDAVLAALAAAGRAAGRERIALVSHRVELSQEEERTREAIARAFREAALKPPSAADVPTLVGASAALADRMLKLLVRQRVLVKLDDLLFHAEALAQLKADLERLRGAAPPARVDVGSFKEKYGITRKFAIPLLEYLDRERVTRRVGDARVIL
jgi:selenocysteine-specific elongation factor